MKVALGLPPLIWGAIWSQALPALALILASHRTRPAGLMVTGSLVSLLSNLVGRVLAAEAGNNQLLSYVSSPATAVCFLWALMDWQLSARERKGFRVSILVFLVVWVALVAFIENMRGFDLITGSLYSLTLLIAGIWTLIRRANAVEAIPIQRSDWFLVSLGMAIQGAATLIGSQIGAILMARGRVDLFVVAWQVRAALVISSFLLISWGIYRGPSVSKFSTIGTIEA